MPEIKNLTKTYEEQQVLQNLNLSLQEKGVYCLMGPSGRGKTTLLRCLAGLEMPDAGAMEGFGSISMVFQEDRLFPEMNAIQNLQMVGIADPQPLLAAILPMDSLSQPVSSLSGGMKRRVAVARAVGVSSEVLLMDEPFTGLDENTRDRVIDFIRKHRRGRLLLLATHSEEDAEKLDAEIIRL